MAHTVPKTIHQSQFKWKNLYRILATTLMLIATSTDAAIFNVTNTNDSGAGSLRAAVNDANNSPGADTVVFSSLAGQTIVLTSGEITISDDLTISGPIAGDAKSIVIDGNNSSRIFFVPSRIPILTLENMTLQRGMVINDHGGAVYVYGAVILNDTIVSESSVMGVPAIGSIVEGGGVFAGQVTLNHSAVFNNSTSGAGGGLSGGNVTVNQSTISGNSAQITGGGLLAYLGVAKILQATITDNSSELGAGGIALAYRTGFLIPSGDFEVENSIISGNSGNDSNVAFITSFVSDVSNSIYGDSPSDIVGVNIGNVFTDNPGLGPLQLNGGSTPTHLPNTRSPAIDAGDNALAPDTVDQRGTGFSRIVNGIVDIGAVERQPPSPIPVFSVSGFVALLTGLIALAGWRQKH